SHRPILWRNRRECQCGAIDSRRGPGVDSIAVRLTRRGFLRTTGAAGIALAAGRAADRAHAQGLRPITLTHSVSTFVYGQHLVAKEKKFFEAEGVSVPGFIVPGGGAKVVQALAAGQAMFALGDSNHPLKITEKGRDALMIFATDTRCSYANVVVRKDLYDKGVKSVEALADVLDGPASNRVFAAPIPVTVGYVVKETVETSPDLVQAYVNATYRAQQWIRRAKDDEIVDLLHTPYMDTFKREDILKSVRY